MQTKLAKVWALLITAVSALGASAAIAMDAPHEIIVKYKDGSLRTRPAMNSLYQGAGVRKVRRMRGLNTGIEQLYLSDAISMDDALASLRKDPTVEYAQPNYLLHALPIQQAAAQPAPQEGIPCIPGFDIPGCDPNATLPCLIPGIPFPPGCEDSGNPGQPGEPEEPGQPSPSKPELQNPPAEVNPPVADPQLAKAYGIEKIGATKAWETHKGNKDFVVAVIDTGIDYNHEDLSFNVWRNPTPGPKNDVAGYDFVHDDGLPFDDNQHGSHCAGTIGGVGGNGVGVSGVAQRISIMGLKFLSGEGSGTTADAIRAIDYAIEHGAKVLSNSWGGKGDDGNQALKDSIDRAKAKDVLFIAAAGNDSTNNDGNNPSYPAAFDNDNLIAVAATDKDDKLAFFSNYGKRTTHLAAPGVNVFSTTPGNKYAQLSGTSMACPHVAGAAALIWSKNPSMTYKEVKQKLLSTVDKVPALAEKTSTGGRLNVLSALRSME